MHMSSKHNTVDMVSCNVSLIIIQVINFLSNDINTQEAALAILPLTMRPDMYMYIGGGSFT